MPSYTGENIVSPIVVNQTPIVCTKDHPFPSLPPNTAHGLQDTKDKCNISVLVDYPDSSDEDTPIANLVTEGQGADVSVPIEFPQLFKEIVQLEGLQMEGLAAETLPSGELIQRLPSVSAEIDQYFKCHENSSQMATQGVFDSYPQQPDFVHRIHTDKHVSLTGKDKVSQARLSSVPWEFSDLRVGPSVIGKAKRSEN